MPKCENKVNKLCNWLPENKCIKEKKCVGECIILNGSFLHPENIDLDNNNFNFIKISTNLDGGCGSFVIITEDIITNNKWECKICVDKNTKFLYYSLIDRRYYIQDPNAQLIIGTIPINTRICNQNVVIDACPKFCEDFTLKIVLPPKVNSDYNEFSLNFTYFSGDCAYIQTIDKFVEKQTIPLDRIILRTQADIEPNKLIQGLYNILITLVVDNGVNTLQYKKILSTEFKCNFELLPTDDEFITT